MNALARNPQQMFGVLIGLERGMAPEGLARRLGSGVNSLLDLVDAARAGELPRHGYWKGERMVSEIVLERQHSRSKGKELFLCDWHRPAIELMLRPQGALSGEISAIAERFGRTSEAGAMIKRVRIAIEDAGFAVESKDNAEGRQSRYRIAAASAPALRALIDNGWVVQ